MIVKVTGTLKNSSVGIISVGTIFKGTEETLPSFILDELKENRGNLEVLPDVAPKKKGKLRKNTKPAEKAEAKSSQKGKAASLRAKLTETEK